MIVDGQENVDVVGQVDSEAKTIQRLPELVTEESFIATIGTKVMKGKNDPSNVQSPNHPFKALVDDKSKSREI